MTKVHFRKTDFLPPCSMPSVAQELVIYLKCGWAHFSFMLTFYHIELRRLFKSVKLRWEPL